jgi:hypothetical protein
VAIEPARDDILSGNYFGAEDGSPNSVLLRGTLEMPNDAKFGLIIGVTVVIAVSVVFFRKEPGRLPPRVGQTAAAVGTTNVTATPSHSMSRPVQAETAAQHAEQSPLR